MSDFTLEPDEVEPDRLMRGRPVRLVSTGLADTAEVPTTVVRAKDPVPAYEQSPRSSRRNLLPAKCIDGSLVMRHEYAARALVELMQIGKAPSGANPVLHHPPEPFNGIQMMTTVGR